MSLRSNMLMIAIAAIVAMNIGCQQSSAQSEHSHAEKKTKVSLQVVEQVQADVQAHADNLYAEIKQSRKELREMRIAAGLHAHAAGPHIDPEGHHANDSPEQQARERNEGEGHEDGGGHERGGERGHREGGERGHREGGERGHREGGERGHREGGEQSARAGDRIAKSAKHVLTYKNGARLTLQYNPAIQAFIGNVTNTTKKPLEDVRVEIHLSNGTELGPTKRTTVKPGQTIPVELGAFGEEFTHWTTHPEAGNEEAHGEGDEESERAGGGHGGERGGHAERERGEHGGKGSHSERERGEHRGERGGHAERERGEHGGEGGGRGHSHDGAGEGGHGVGDASLRPVYNQLQLLRGEMAAFAEDLKKREK